MSEKSKSGYELRVEVLHLAKDIVEHAAHLELAKVADGDKSVVKPVTVDAVLIEAERLYEFVQKK
tara:strand:+ start:602 stop:796 length:195 start_codon:yes stop_codon:yes gene_type:complete